MVGGLAGGNKKKGGGNAPPGQLPRPNSLGDFNEAEEESWNIGQMSDDDIMQVLSCIVQDF